MDKLLRPERLETEPTTSNSEKLYRHWKMTFQNYLESCEPALPTPAADADPQEAAAATQVATNNRDQKRRAALFNNVSPTIFDMISECATYDAAFTVLDAAYVRPVSVIYNRHKLSTCKQEPAQSIDAFVQELQRLAKPCNFAEVTADQNRNEHIRDAFINGIASANIRQRLLENNELTLDQALQLARAQEQAQVHSQSFDNNVAAIPEPEPPLAAVQSKNTYQGNYSKFDKKTTSSPSTSNTNKFVGWQRASKEQNRCFHCGGPDHPRPNCPAKNKICNNCKKKGHLEQVCQSPPAGIAAFADNLPSTMDHHSPSLF